MACCPTVSREASHERICRLELASASMFHRGHSPAAPSCQLHCRSENEWCPGAHRRPLTPPWSAATAEGGARIARGGRDSSLTPVGHPPASLLVPVIPPQVLGDVDGQGGEARKQGSASGGSVGGGHEPVGLLPAEGGAAAAAQAPLWVCSATSAGSTSPSRG